jgi:hypothetical protein
MVEVDTLQGSRAQLLRKLHAPREAGRLFEGERASTVPCVIIVTDFGSVALGARGLVGPALSSAVLSSAPTVVPPMPPARRAFVGTLLSVVVSACGAKSLSSQGDPEPGSDDAVESAEQSEGVGPSEGDPVGTKRGTGSGALVGDDDFTDDDGIVDAPSLITSPDDEEPIVVLRPAEQESADPCVGEALKVAIRPLLLSLSLDASPLLRPGELDPVQAYWEPLLVELEMLVQAPPAAQLYVALTTFPQSAEGCAPGGVFESFESSPEALPDGPLLKPLHDLPLSPPESSIDAGLSTLATPMWSAAMGAATALREHVDGWVRAEKMSVMIVAAESAACIDSTPDAGARADIDSHVLAIDWGFGQSASVHALANRIAEDEALIVTPDGVYDTLRRLPVERCMIDLPQVVSQWSSDTLQLSYNNDLGVSEFRYDPDCQSDFAWYFGKTVDGATPTTIVLCPDVCTQIHQDVGNHGQLHLRGACPPGPGPR